MKNNLIQEELKRFKLLSGYKTSNTLSENIEIIREGIGNVAVETLFKDMASAGRAELKTGIEAAIRDWGGIFVTDSRGVATVSKDVDEIIRAMERGTISSTTEAGKLAKSFLKDGALGMKESAAEAIVSLSSFETKYGKITREEAIKKLMGVKYTQGEAELLMNKFEALKGGKAPVPVHPEPVKPEPVKPEPVRTEPPVVTTPPPWYQRSWDWMRNSKWGRRILIAGSIYAAYKLWKYFFGDDDDVPLCMKSYVDTPEKFEKYLNDGFISVQGYKLYPNKDAKITFPGGGEESGEWSVVGEEVVIKIKGVTNSIPCSSVLPVPEPTGDGGGGGGGGGGDKSYNNCDSFPIIQGCSGQKVKDIQKCLGGLTVDGKYGPKTQSKASSAGYGDDGFTEDEYNKLMQKCGVQTAPEEKPTGPEIIVDPMLEK